MGLFKGMKDLAGVTKQAKQMQEQQQKDAGYKPGFGGQMQQMGDMLGQANQQMSELSEQMGDQDRLLAEGIAGEAVIVGMGTPARGASQYNLDLDLEVHVSGRSPYRVAKQYIVPASAQLGPGVKLPVKVDPSDQARLAIDWESAGSGPVRGEVRSAGGGQELSGGVASPSGGGDKVADLERLAKLKESGALTDAEFEQQKANILGS